MYEDFTPLDNLGYPSNGPECQLFIHAKRQGWRVSKRGWPDFFCISPAGKVVMVEVKPWSEKLGRFQLLKREQTLIMDYFSALGVECYVSDGKRFERYERAKHGNASLRRTPSRLCTIPAPTG
jgi:hypothetical protein